MQHADQRTPDKYVRKIELRFHRRTRSDKPAPAPGPADRETGHDHYDRKPRLGGRQGFSEYQKRGRPEHPAETGKGKREERKRKG